MKGIYLFSGYAAHTKYELDYCDLDKKSLANLKCDVKKIDLSKYDYYIATPPCNFWSKAVGNRKSSEYALKTKDLLLWSITELSKFKKPLIIENVRNLKKFDKYGILEAANKNELYIHFVGRHTYFTNQFINLSCKQSFDFKHGGYRRKKFNECKGGNNVYNVIEIFLSHVNKI